MLNNVYRLVAPRKIEPVMVDVSCADRVVVRPTRLSICNADQRYYQGLRDPDVLQHKLPMALVHEAVGEVLADPTGTFRPGDVVVLLPNESHAHNVPFGENYDPAAAFCGSTADGFMQELVVLPPGRVRRVDPGIDVNIAAFTEIVSVAAHAVRRFDAIADAHRRAVGVWGDGTLGFVVALMLKTLWPDVGVCVVGHNAYKLEEFTFADEALLADAVPADLQVDHAFECCGGIGSPEAVDQIIDHIRPEGTVALLGVSENPVPVRTRMVLEKGLRLFGSSRSAADDFAFVLDLYRTHPEILGYLSTMVGTVVPVANISDMGRAFRIDTQKVMGKTIMAWDV